MNLVKYNRNKHMPFGGLFDDLINSSLSDFMGGTYVNSSPSINIIEENDRFLIEVASPGLEKKNFNIQIDNDHLIISAKKEEKSQEREDNCERQEFNYSSFERSFYLPETVDPSKVDANYQNGILTILLNKKEESINKGPQKIVIN